MANQENMEKGPRTEDNLQRMLAILWVASCQLVREEREKTFLTNARERTGKEKPKKFPSSSLLHH